MASALTARDLSRLVLDPDFKIATADLVDLSTLDAAIDELATVPALKEQDPALVSEAATRIENHLRPIGAKIAPTMDGEQAFAWRKSVVLALSDLPARVVEYAASKAVHKPMQFPREVDGIIREIAEEAMQKQRTALARLRSWRAEIERIQNPPPMLAAEPEVWTQADIDQANASFRRLGLKIRYRIGEDGTVENYESSADEREAERQETAKIDPD